MLKRTLYFTNPAYLSSRLKQLVVSFPAETERPASSVPLEDLGMLVLEDRSITITNSLLGDCMVHNITVVVCDEKHMPGGLLLPLEGNTLLGDRSRMQMDTSQPLKKQLWQQLVQAKVRNQAEILKWRGMNYRPLLSMVPEIKSGDSGNIEGAAARFYWMQMMGELDTADRRHRTGDPPNNALNYIYAIIRAMVARALVGSGLLPQLGIHHGNKYNAYPLADDVMEPFRPMADKLVWELLDDGHDMEILTTSIKAELLKVAQVDVMMEGEISPLLIATQRVAAGLVAVLAGEKRKLALPEPIV